MKKIIKTIGVLVAFAGLSCNLSSCFFPSQTEKELSYEEIVEKGKVKNFTITQKEGTNILVFKWEKPEYLCSSYDNEVVYIIRLEDAPDSTYYTLGSIECKESADSTVIQKEYLMDGSLFNCNFRESGDYSFWIWQEGYPVSPDTAVSENVEFTRYIVTPQSLEILEISDDDNYWDFKFNQFGKDSGNRGFILYINEKNDITNASLVNDYFTLPMKYGFNDEYDYYWHKNRYYIIENEKYADSIEVFIYKKDNPKLVAGKSYYAWVKLADEVEYEYDEESRKNNIIDSSKYGKPSNSVYFTLPAEEEE